MPVPEAPVHEDAGAILRQDDVGRPWQHAHVHPEPEPSPMQPPTHLQLRRGVLAVDAGHVVGALEGSEGGGHFLYQNYSVLNIRHSTQV